jgi:tRNA-binding EMAP/Myf-like protein
MKITEVFVKSEQSNPNYLAEFVKVDNVRKHPDADKLDLVTVYGNDIVVEKGSVAIGDVMIYCPVESALSKEFLSTLNQFREVELNANKDIKGGFFEHHGRIKAVRLRGIPSTGFLFPTKWIVAYSQAIDSESALNVEEDWHALVGTSFDVFNGKPFIKKYLPKVKNKNPLAGTKNRLNKRLRYFDKLIENQFNFHIDTEQFAKNLRSINPDDIVQITSKIHGTSAIFSYLLVNKQLNFFQKLLKRVGVTVQDQHYDYIWASRKVIKNRYINAKAKDYYEQDVWSAAFEVVKPFLTKGMTIYAEIVGYVKDTA